VIVNLWPCNRSADVAASAAENSSEEGARMGVVAEEVSG